MSTGVNDQTAWWITPALWKLDLATPTAPTPPWANPPSPSSLPSTDEERCEASQEIKREPSADEERQRSEPEEREPARSEEGDSTDRPTALLLDP